MSHIPLPQKIDFKREAKNRGTYTIEPFYPGYGTTIGNALRRILLSSIKGAAITSVKIKGIEHEYSTIEGIKEDVVDIILNLKKVRIQLAQELIDGPVTIALSKKGEGEVKAGDFETPTGVEIVNKDLVIANITEQSSSLEIEAKLNEGIGYSSVEQREEKKDQEIGVIEIDALYSPVVKVAYRVENVRVGQMTNYDRLNLEIETDGTMSPQEVFQQAVEILKDHTNFLLNPQAVKDETVSESQKEES